MIKVQTFTFDQYAEMNKFLEKHSPRGENGLRISSTHMIVFYEDGMPMSKNDKIASLTFELGKSIESAMQYDKQVRKAVLLRDSFKDTRSQSFIDSDGLVMTSRKQMEMEQISIQVLAEMLGELGVKFDVSSFLSAKQKKAAKK